MESLGKSLWRDQLCLMSTVRCNKSFHNPNVRFARASVALLPPSQRFHMLLAWAQPAFFFICSEGGDEAMRVPDLGERTMFLKSPQSLSSLQVNFFPLYSLLLVPSPIESGMDSSNCRTRKCQRSDNSWKSSASWWHVIGLSNRVSSLA